MQDVTGRKGPFPDDKFIKGPGEVMTIILTIASPNDQVRIRVSVISGNSANWVTSSEGPINIDFQTIALGPSKENVSPIWSWGYRERLFPHLIHNLLFKSHLNINYRVYLQTVSPQKFKFLDFKPSCIKLRIKIRTWHSNYTQTLCNKVLSGACGTRSSSFGKKRGTVFLL